MPARSPGRARRSQIADPNAARALGIGMVFQHFSLFETLTVAENIALGLGSTPVLAALTARDPPDRRAIRAGGGSRPPCPPPFGRRAAAGRDPALPAATPEAADHGRADQRADAAGGGRAVRHAAPVGGGRLQRPLHQPQAGGDPRALHCGDGAARRPGGGALRPADRDRGIAGRDDDGRRPGPDPPPASHADRRALPGGGPPDPARRASPSAPRCATSRWNCAPARSSASPASPATARRSCWRRSPGSAGRRPARCCWKAGRSAGWARPRAARLGLAFIPEERLGRGAVGGIQPGGNALLTRVDAVTAPRGLLDRGR